MGAVMSTDLRRRRDELVRRVSRVDSAAEVFAEASTQLRRLVPHDAAVWLMTDPGTGLPTAPTRVEGFDATPGLCSAHWRHEFLVDDVNLFRDLVRADTPASALRATAGDPERSARFRTFLRPVGFADELRTVLRVGDAPWATVTLWRRDNRAPFSRQETALMASLSAPVGEALRVRARSQEALGGLARQDRPGLMIFDRDGELISINENATAWLAELPSDDRVPTDLGVELPVWMVVTVLRAGEGGDGTARIRVRSRHGLWLVCHASCLRDADGSLTRIALVVEAASPAQIAPIVTAAYDLSEREQQITRLIARGADTNEIAGELFLSVHTVRDHIKVIFSKVGVSSRGELVATLYADFYEPAHLEEESPDSAS